MQSNMHWFKWARTSETHPHIQCVTLKDTVYTSLCWKGYILNVFSVQFKTDISISYYIMQINAKNIWILNDDLVTTYEAFLTFSSISCFLLSSFLSCSSTTFCLRACRSSSCLRRKAFSSSSCLRARTTWYWAWDSRSRHWFASAAAAPRSYFSRSPFTLRCWKYLEKSYSIRHTVCSCKEIFLSMHTTSCYRTTFL